MQRHIKRYYHGLYPSYTNLTNLNPVMETSVPKGISTDLIVPVSSDKGHGQSCFGKTTEYSGYTNIRNVTKYNERMVYKVEPMHYCTVINSNKFSITRITNDYFNNTATLYGISQILHLTWVIHSRIVLTVLTLYL